MNGTNYDDLLHLPHHQSETHPHMPRAGRAAQFSPFAALSGYEEAIAEAARRTEQRTQPDENALEELNYLLMQMEKQIASHPEVTVTYFRPDDRKAGGRYLTRVGNVKAIDRDGERLCLTDGTEIPLKELLALSLHADSGAEQTEE